MVGIDKMGGVLEDGRRRQGMGGGGQSTGVELVCHDWAGKRRDGGGGERKGRGRERRRVC